MKNILNIILISILTVGYANAQDNLKTVEYNELLELKVDENRFEFGWLPDSYRKTPCFRDYTHNDIETELVDSKSDSVFYKSLQPKRNGLVIVPSNIKIDKKNKTFQITGKINGGWKSVIPFEFEIYIGRRTDTISNITLSPISCYGEVTFNGKKIDSTIVVGHVPAFYLSDFKKFNAYRGTKNMKNSKYKEMLFDISAIIDEKSILVFGLSSRYAEIFEIGKLLTE